MTICSTETTVHAVLKMKTIVSLFTKDTVLQAHINGQQCLHLATTKYRFGNVQGLGFKHLRLCLALSGTLASNVKSVARSLLFAHNILARPVYDHFVRVTISNITKTECAETKIPQAAFLSSCSKQVGYRRC